MDARIKVLHLRSSGGFYGAERSIVALCRALRDSCDLTVVCFDEGGKEKALLQQAAEAGCSTASIPTAGAVRHVRRMLQDGAAILHCHDYKADLLGRFAARGLPVGLVATAHGWTGATLRLRLYEWMDRRALTHFHRVVAVSEESLARLAHVGIPPERLALVRNALDGVSPVPARSPKNAVPVVVSVGRLSREKGHRFLLEACSHLARRGRNVRLAIAGSGPDLDSLISLARRLGITDRVLFLGHQDNVGDLLASADVFVLPSLKESLPLALLEACAAGVPAVASGVGGVGEVVTDGRTGLLVWPGDSHSLADAIQMLLDNPEAAVRMAQAAQEHVRSAFSVDEAAAAMMRVYRDAMSVAGKGA
jgi:glycosyltransferase involved in cell wall biosynthesis